ncbi:MAG: hypothetical protein HY023_17720 [Chloroflexi bacterium]|nr:hypothetical protein [Chloroflexota bacterium]MBI3760265.1 hypothetical protein [Chloroflexota bacterium]
MSEFTIAAQTLTVRKDEPLAVPLEFKEAIGLGEGGTYTVVRFNGLLLVYPKRLVSLQILENMRRVFEDDGVTLDALLNGLADIRQKIYDERYAHP